MSTALFAMRRDSASHKDVRTVLLRVCFDFVIDANWRVWLVDVDPSCDLNVGGDEFTSSPCKHAGSDTMGEGAIKLVEEIDRRRSKGISVNTNALPLGDHFEALVDEDSNDFDLRDNLCTISEYKKFRQRQIFPKMAVADLVLAVDIHGTLPDAPSDLGDWSCPICGYKNKGQVHFCEACGHNTPKLPN